MWIDTTYFFGGITIPNLTGEGVVPATVRKNLEWFIAKYEPEFIKLVLGDTLAELLVASMLEGANPEELEKWTALYNKFVDSENLLSPIADYVYYHSERNRLTSTTLSGEKSSKHENSDSVINSEKVTTAYNNALQAGIEIREWVESHITDYPEYDTEELKDISGYMNNFGL